MRIRDWSSDVCSSDLIREVLKREGAIAAEDARIDILAPSGMTDQEKHFACVYSGGQVVMFARDNAGLGVAAGAEYRVSGIARDARGRQIVRLVDEKGRTILWNPRLGRASQVKVFSGDKRDIAAGDRIQWRLVNTERAPQKDHTGHNEGTKP